MIRKLLPVLLAVLGLAIGLGAGYFLRPSAAPATEAAAADAGHAAAPAEAAAGAHGAAEPAAADHAAAEPAAESTAHGASDGSPDYVKLTNQFVVPLINAGKVGSMVIVSLSVEVKAGETAVVFSREPKLRDSFLQVMFDHANAGGFDGPFTDSANMIALRRALLEAAQQVLGESATDVLITDIVRQDT